uniref:Uncharacterized protein n=1 Tax=Vannella robusta TaxID=1487602 RepID=A0A7S4MDD0_9EUKA|mmetsp:Transcript_18858/g.23893  ORF Transcript_18858/g.23893 Transcript_18858/m.23893 type:complete len:120 (+) Transcript_18858:243-602(+)
MQPNVQKVYGFFVSKACTEFHEDLDRCIRINGLTGTSAGSIDSKCAEELRGYQACLTNQSSSSIFQKILDSSKTICPEKHRAYTLCVQKEGDPSKCQDSFMKAIECASDYIAEQITRHE